MTAELYEKQRTMAILQGEIEGIQVQNQALEQDFENEIERKNNNNKQVGQIISSIGNIHETCKKLIEMQSKNKVKEKVENEKNKKKNELLEKPNLIGELQNKLSLSVSKISELTKVLEELNSEYTVERYYEDSAKQAMQLTMKATVSQIGSIVQQRAAAKSDIPTNSQYTGTNISQNRTRSLKKH